MNVSSRLHGLTRPAVALAAAGALCAAVAAGPALAQTPGLPANYDVQRIDTPHPEGSPSKTDPTVEENPESPTSAAPNFGWGVTSADLNGDADRELLVAQSQSNFDGEIHIFDGETGKKVETIVPPEGRENGVELAFIYVETMPDIGRCSNGESSKICGSTIGDPDGIPEILAGSRALTIDAQGKAIGETGFDANTGKKVGRAYIFDGRTRAVLKKIDMPLADRNTQPGGANFGRLVMSPSGLPACKGPGTEGNDAGTAPCPSELDLPPNVRRGDVDGDDVPDIVVTARGYQQSRDSVAARAPNSECAQKVASGPGKNCTTGRAWIYSGKAAIADRDPNKPFDTPYKTIDNPTPQANSQEFGGNVFRVGDTTGDKLPEFLIAARGTDYPIASPDPEATDVGAGFLVNGNTGAIVRNYTHPEPQAGAQFTWSFNSGPAPGDLGETAFADLFLPAPDQNRERVDQGRGFVFSPSSNRHFATVDDPTPANGGEFGASQAGVGDLVPGPDKPKNELLVGGVGPYTQQTDETARLVTDVHFFNPQTGTALQTITDPDKNPGTNFGSGITPMGDLNEDGFLDFGVTAFTSDAPPNGQPAQGRAFIFRSNNTPPPTVPPPPKPGGCANDKYGTQKADNLRGTNAGDRIFVFAGNDVVDALAGDDCIDGGTGGDGLSGGLGNDTVVAQGGHDVVFGQGGNDRLYGGDGNDGMTGGAGRDLLAGARGADVLRGDLDDQIYGEAGEDRISAGRGRTRIDAGNDNDYVIARNGRVDTINCGRGRDTARVDRTDRVAGCERVIRG